MKQLNFNNCYTDADKTSSWTRNRKYRIYDGVDIVYYTSKTTMNRELIKMAKFYTDLMYKSVNLYAEVIKSYWENWGYFEREKVYNTGHKIEEKFGYISKLFNEIPKQARYSSGLSYTRQNFMTIYKYLREILVEMQIASKGVMLRYKFEYQLQMITEFQEQLEEKKWIGYEKKMSAQGIKEELNENMKVI